MKLLASTLLAAAVVLTAGAVRADTGNDVKNGAENTGKTVSHGTTAVGKGASKIYHDAAKGVHKIIAKNTDDPHKKAVHLKKAEIHKEHATEKARQSDKELNKASKDADKVTK